MGLLQGFDQTDNWTSELYGRYSHGNIYKSLLDPAEIRNAVTEWVSRDLKKAGVYHDLRDRDVMDVGTGRQALALAMLGAKSVEHFDISSDHVARFSKLLREHYGDLPITTKNMDLCRTAPPVEAYEFIYLNGIVHHFSDTAAGLRNCAAAVRPGGKIWVYFYRSGTFKWFVCSMIRALTAANELDRVFAASAMIYDEGQGGGMTTSRIMDDFFAPYIYLYSPFQYIDFMDRLGFRICGSSDLDPLCAVNHECLHHSATLVFQRDRKVDVGSIDTGALLTPAGEIDQLDPALYDDERPRKSIALFRDVLRAAQEGDSGEIVFAARLSLHRIAARQYYGGVELPPDYECLNGVLTQTLEAMRTTQPRFSGRERTTSGGLVR